MPTDYWKEADARNRRKREALHRRILAIPGARHDIDRLVRAGAEREELLRRLSATVTDFGFWRKGMKRKKRQLESVANQLETVARHAERLSLDLSTYGSFWLPMLGLASWNVVKNPEDFAPVYIFRLMRLYAQNCKERGKQMGSLLRDHPPRQRRQMIDFLMIYVWQQTGNHYDAEVARLLTDALEACDNKMLSRKRPFSVELVKKHRQRYVMPSIRAYLKKRRALASGKPPQ